MAKKKKKTIALIYDFDGTLSPGNMQEFGFMKAIGSNKKAFWMENTKLSTEHDASEILCYMHLMIKYAAAKNISLKRSSFQHFGTDIELYEGVPEWFSLINEYGKSKSVIIEHYINSSGLTEIIEGTPIAKEFRKIFACSYLYDIDGRAYWPAVAVDYTGKTQFIFKINKGIDSVRDNKEINRYTPESERKIPFEHMIYFGDGETDIPCMKLIKQQGGHSIAVYKPRDRKKKSIAEKLIAENRVNFVCPADYSYDKEMYKVVTRIIDRIVSEEDFDDLLSEHKGKVKKTNSSRI